MSLKNFLFSSKGRISRQAFIIYQFTVFLLFCLSYIIYFISLQSIEIEDGKIIPIIIIILNIIIYAFSLLAAIIHLFVAIKRFHDIGRSDWYSVLTFIPVINLYAFFLLFFEKGTTGSNRYGDSPLSN